MIKKFTLTVKNNLGGSAYYYSISPAIPSGLSFNTKTGTISGAPIIASDSVTYTVTAVGRRGRDTATVVITFFLLPRSTCHQAPCS
jgi:hypothetical protein